MKAKNKDFVKWLNSLHQDRRRHHFNNIYKVLRRKNKDQADQLLRQSVHQFGIFCQVRLHHLTKEQIQSYLGNKSQPRNIVSSATVSTNGEESKKLYGYKNEESDTEVSLNQDTNQLFEIKNENTLQENDYKKEALSTQEKTKTDKNINILNKEDQNDANISEVSSGVPQENQLKDDASENESLPNQEKTDKNINLMNKEDQNDANISEVSSGVPQENQLKDDASENESLSNQEETVKNVNVLNKEDQNDSNISEVSSGVPRENQLKDDASENESLSNQEETVKNVNVLNKEDQNDDNISEVSSGVPQENQLKDDASENESLTNQEETVKNVNVLNKEDQNDDYISEVSSGVPQENQLKDDASENESLTNQEETVKNVNVLNKEDQNYSNVSEVSSGVPQENQLNDDASENESLSNQEETVKNVNVLNKEDQNDDNISEVSSGVPQENQLKDDASENESLTNQEETVKNVNVLNKEDQNDDNISEVSSGVPQENQLKDDASENESLTNQEETVKNVNVLNKEDQNDSNVSEVSSGVPQENQLNDDASENESLTNQEETVKNVNVLNKEDKNDCNISEVSSGVPQENQLKDDASENESLTNQEETVKNVNVLNKEDQNDAMASTVSGDLHPSLDVNNSENLRIDTTEKVNVIKKNSNNDKIQERIQEKQLLPYDNYLLKDWWMKYKFNFSGEKVCASSHYVNCSSDYTAGWPDLFDEPISELEKPGDKQITLILSEIERLEEEKNSLPVLESSYSESEIISDCDKTVSSPEILADTIPSYNLASITKNTNNTFLIDSNISKDDDFVQRRPPLPSCSPPRIPPPPPMPVASEPSYSPPSLPSSTVSIELQPDVIAEIPLPPSPQDSSKLHILEATQHSINSSETTKPVSSKPSLVSFKFKKRTNHGLKVSPLVSHPTKKSELLMYHQTSSSLVPTVHKTFDSESQGSAQSSINIGTSILKLLPVLQDNHSSVRLTPSPTPSTVTLVSQSSTALPNFQMSLNPPEKYQNNTVLQTSLGVSADKTSKNRKNLTLCRNLLRRTNLHTLNCWKSKFKCTENRMKKSRMRKSNFKNVKFKKNTKTTMRLKQLLSRKNKIIFSSKQKLNSPKTNDCNTLYTCDQIEIENVSLVDEGSNSSFDIYDDIPSDIYLSPTCSSAEIIKCNEIKTIGELENLVVLSNAQTSYENALSFDNRNPFDPNKSISTLTKDIEASTDFNHELPKATRLPHLEETTVCENNENVRQCVDESIPGDPVAITYVEDEENIEIEFNHTLNAMKTDLTNVCGISTKSSQESTVSSAAKSNIMETFPDMLKENNDVRGNKDENSLSNVQVKNLNKENIVFSESSETSIARNSTTDMESYPKTINTTGVLMENENNLLSSIQVTNIRTESVILSVPTPVSASLSTATNSTIQELDKQITNNKFNLEDKPDDGKNILRDLQISSSDDESDEEDYVRPRIINGFGDPFVISQSKWNDLPFKVKTEVLNDLRDTPQLEINTDKPAPSTKRKHNDIPTKSPNYLKSDKFLLKQSVPVILKTESLAKKVQEVSKISSIRGSGIKNKKYHSKDRVLPLKPKNQFVTAKNNDQRRIHKSNKPTDRHKALEQVKRSKEIDINVGTPETLGSPNTLKSTETSSGNPGKRDITITNQRRVSDKNSETRSYIPVQNVVSTKTTDDKDKRSAYNASPGKNSEVVIPPNKPDQIEKTYQPSSVRKRLKSEVENIIPIKRDSKKTVRNCIQRTFSLPEQSNSKLINPVFDSIFKSMEESPPPRSLAIKEPESQKYVARPYWCTESSNSTSFVNQNRKDISSEKDPSNLQPKPTFSNSQLVKIDSSGRALEPIKGLKRSYHLSSDIHGKKWKSSNLNVKPNQNITSDKSSGKANTSVGNISIQDKKCSKKCAVKKQENIKKGERVKTKNVFSSTPKSGDLGNDIKNKEITRESFPSMPSIELNTDLEGVHSTNEQGISNKNKEISRDPLPKMPSIELNTDLEGVNSTNEQGISNKNKEISRDPLPKMPSIELNNDVGLLTNKQDNSNKNKDITREPFPSMPSIELNNDLGLLANKQGNSLNYSSTSNKVLTNSSVFKHNRPLLISAKELNKLKLKVSIPIFHFYSIKACKEKLLDELPPIKKKKAKDSGCSISNLSFENTPVRGNKMCKMKQQKIKKNKAQRNKKSKALDISTTKENSSFRNVMNCDEAQKKMDKKGSKLKRKSSPLTKEVINQLKCEDNFTLYDGPGLLMADLNSQPKLSQAETVQLSGTRLRQTSVSSGCGSPSNQETFSSACLKTNVDFNENSSKPHPLLSRLDSEQENGQATNGSARKSVDDSELFTQDIHPLESTNDKVLSRSEATANRPLTLRVKSPSSLQSGPDQPLGQSSITRRRISVLSPEALSNQVQPNDQESVKRTTWYVEPESTDNAQLERAEEKCPGKNIKSIFNDFFCEENRKKELISLFEMSIKMASKEYVQLEDIIKCIQFDYAQKGDFIERVKKLKSVEVVELEIKRATNEYERKLVERKKFLQKTFSNLIDYFKCASDYFYLSIYVFLSQKIQHICNDTDLKESLFLVFKKWIRNDRNKHVFDQSEMAFINDCSIVLKILNEVKDFPLLISNCNTYVSSRCLKMEMEQESTPVSKENNCKENEALFSSTVTTNTISNSAESSERYNSTLENVDHNIIQTSTCQLSPQNRENSQVPNLNTNEISQNVNEISTLTSVITRALANDKNVSHISGNHLPTDGTGVAPNFSTSSIPEDLMVEPPRQGLGNRPNNTEVNMVFNQNNVYDVTSTGTMSQHIQHNHQRNKQVRNNLSTSSNTENVMTENVGRIPQIPVINMSVSPVHPAMQNVTSNQLPVFQTVNGKNTHGKNTQNSQMTQQSLSNTSCNQVTNITMVQTQPVVTVYQVLPSQEQPVHWRGNTIQQPSDHQNNNILHRQTTTVVNTFVSPQPSPHFQQLLDKQQTHLVNTRNQFDQQILWQSKHQSPQPYINQFANLNPNTTQYPHQNVMYQNVRQTQMGRSLDMHPHQNTGMPGFGGFPQNTGQNTSHKMQQHNLCNETSVHPHQNTGMPGFGGFPQNTGQNTSHKMQQHNLCNETSVHPNQNTGMPGFGGFPQNTGQNTSHKMQQHNLCNETSVHPHQNTGMPGFGGFPQNTGQNTSHKMQQHNLCNETSVHPNQNTGMPGFGGFPQNTGQNTSHKMQHHNLCNETSVQPVRQHYSQSRQPRTQSYQQQADGNLSIVTRRSSMETPQTVDVQQRTQFIPNVSSSNGHLATTPFSDGHSQHSINNVSYDSLVSGQLQSRRTPNEVLESTDPFTQDELDKLCSIIDSDRLMGLIDGTNKVDNNDNQSLSSNILDFNSTPKDLLKPISFTDSRRAALVNINKNWQIISKMPDSHLNFNGVNVTKGQLLRFVKDCKDQVASAGLKEDGETTFIGNYPLSEGGFLDQEQTAALMRGVIAMNARTITKIRIRETNKETSNSMLIKALKLTAFKDFSSYLRIISILKKLAENEKNTDAIRAVEEIAAILSPFKAPNKWAESDQVITIDD
ncbi:uncharacterized protein LOC129003255 [Macrosteles quadrilineatus]|uniref:uncharacterized protein LOC129003255 n=1 Tax=Macrosteles quadrilineatus TaxID=74068 RepID=UPI0023E1A745|nr:uncharacterized protein LOC129003255 [Macrosteles quadrilineatus]